MDLAVRQAPSQAKPHHQLFQLLVGQLRVKPAQYPFDLLHAATNLVISQPLARDVGGHGGSLPRGRVSEAPAPNGLDEPISSIPAPTASRIDPNMHDATPDSTARECPISQGRR